MAEYLLARHAHLCLTDDGAVILDTKHDRYIGLGLDDVRSLSRCLLGFQIEESIGPAEVDNTERCEIGLQLLEAGLLTRDENHGRQVESVTLDRPVCAILDDDVGFKPAVRFLDVYNFVIAFLCTYIALRFVSFDAALRQDRRIKARASRHQEANLASARRLVSVFRRLRPWMYTAREKCLLDSLVLSRFLARYDLFPTVAFGVATRPFRAHCWVQSSDVVFNCDPEEAKAYHPILIL